MVEKIKILSFIKQDGRDIPKVATQLCWPDRLGGARVRCALGRMKYTVEPGLYAVGDPGGESPVLVSANYKLSFDALRSQLGGLDAWILVLDTKGINVWCAAGKGTFGTDEVVRRIEETGLEKIVDHRKIIVPQLGAVGVAAHEVKKRSGFSVVYGPVRARDIIEFIAAGNKASEQMRQVRFNMYDRLILVPVEILITGKYLLWAVAIIILLSGISRQGYSLAKSDGIGSAMNLLAGYVGALVIGPMLLPWLPGRSFSVKGFWAGIIVAGVLAFSRMLGVGVEAAGWVCLIVSASSFLVMNYTGTSTYTSPSGVAKETKVAVPLQIFAAVAGLVLFVGSKFV